MFGLVVNVDSPLWFSKVVSTRREQERRGDVLKEYTVRFVMSVMIEPSDWYTFSSVNGMSDIDVTLGYELRDNFEYEWAMKNEWCVSDHNVI